MSAAQHAHAHDVPCPDPSVHEKSNKLSEQASTAALYVTHPERATEARVYQENPLGPDGKLSSKSAAASLKYAKPQDLPSFPSNGLSADSAGKAAMLAKDYKMKDLWQPEQSLAGSKAAVLAQAKGGKLDLWQASASSDGHSAATLAMRNKGLSPAAYTGVDAENRNKALLAATMSASKGRQRAESSPAPPPPSYPDAHNSTHNALNAATVSHRTSTIKSSTADGWDSDAMQAARIKNSHMEREMFSAAPPVDIEREEARHQAALRASAVSMAKQIYDSQDRNVMVADADELAGAQAAANRSSTSSGPTDLKQEAMKYISLQETAHKLAAERLAKVDKGLEDSRYREYYGYGDKPKRLVTRMSLRSVGGGRQRTRAASDGTSNLDDESDDEEQARRIRSQMSQLNTGLTQIDQKKQQDDRARLMAAAEKRVSQRMHNMDERVYADTGKVSPALMEEWEAKARERAQKERELQAQNPGKTHIGGGKFMDQSEIEAIAAARLKPTLDDINDTAEKKRARDEEIRLEKEENERQKREERQTKKEEKDEQKRAKNEEKAVAKQQKDEEKARKAEEKRVAKEDKRKSRDVKREEAKDTAAAVAGGAALAEVADRVKEEDEPEQEGTASEGVQRHRSAISRLKDRFRRSHDEAGDEKEKSSHTAAAAAGGAATGATLTEVADEHEPLDSQQAAHAVASDEGDKDVVASPVSPVAAQETSTLVAPTAPVVAESSKAAEPVEDKDDKWKPVAAPTAAAVGAGAVAPAIIVDEDEDADDELPAMEKSRPPFEQNPSLSGFHNDEVPTVARLDLERHISHIPESDGDDGDDEDWNDDRADKPAATLSEQRAEIIADRVAGAPVVEPSTASATAPTTSTITAAHTETPVATTATTDKALAPLDDQRAEPPKDLPETIESPGVPKTTAAVDEADTKLQTEPGHKEHSILRQIINPGGDKYDQVAFGENAQEVPAEELKEEKPEKEHNILRQIINPGGDKYDSTAFPAPEEPKEENATTSAAAATPVVAAAATTSATQQEKPGHAKLTKSHASQESEKERKGGLRGFFNKLGSRKSKGENKYPDFKSVSKSESVPYEDHKAAQKPVAGTTVSAAKASEAPKAESSTAAPASTTLPPVETGPTFGEEHMGTDGQIGSKEKVSGVNGNPSATEPESPSSFQRNEANTHDPDDVSSSGADEEDIQRGRGGRIARKLGFGGSRTYKNDDKTAADGKKLAPLATGPERQGSTDQDETFEEARDHFDENLAPPPAFAGQAKSESPVRETKFQEQL